MGIEDRDWYRESYRSKERKANGSWYQNTYGWYYRLRGETFGPSDKDNILRLVREHTLDEYSLVKHEGLPDWTPIGKLSYEFPLHSSGRRSGSGTARTGNFYTYAAPLKNDWAWFLAIIPIYWTFIDALLGKYGFSDTVGIIACIALETTAALLDMKRARDAGYDTKDWLWIMYLWTPAYLIQRSRKTDHKKGYVITAIVMSVAYILFYGVIFYLQDQRMR